MQQVQTAPAVTDTDFQLLIEQMNDGFGIQDESGILTYVNDSLCQMLDYTPAELIGRRVIDLIHEDSRSLYEERNAHREAGKSARYEHDMLTKSGERISVLVSAQPIVDCDGRTTGTFAVITDITERKQAEEALRESEQNFRLLVDQMNDGFGIQDEQGRVVYANDKAVEMLGYSRDELYGRVVLELVDGGEQAAFVERMQTRRRGEPDRYELVLKRKNGEKLPLIVSAQPLRSPDGTYRGTFAVLVDITERKLAESALRESEQRFRSLVERMNDGFGIQDEAGVLTFANDRLCQMLEYEAGELTGRTVASLVHQDSRETLERRMAERRTGQPHSFEVKMVTKSGGSVFVIVSGRPIIDPDGTYVGSTAVITDITERKRAEDALRESEQRFRDIFEAAFEGIVVHDDGVILDANPAFERLMNRPLSELLGSYLPDLAPKERRAELVERLNSTAGEYEAFGETPDGNEIILETVTREHVYQGKPVRVTTLRDVTSKKRAEEARQRALEELEGKVERGMVQRNPYGLTFREFTVLHHLATGKADKEIAAELVISPLTVHKHVANILAKMHASSRTEAGVRALREGLLD